MVKPADIDAYLALQSPERRAPLQQLRATIHGILPGVEECISYSMPAFRYQGKVVAGFLATSKGCSYFPFSGTTLGTLAAELRGYSQTKSALHFAAEKPLPAALVRKLLAARIGELGPSSRAPRAKASVRKSSSPPRPPRKKRATKPARRAP
jgi:uncharacterized protein YdhG (YjbR/CyaY superfamily)